MSAILWLASYPKSGNTWLRAFLSNLMAGQEEPASINALLTDGGAASRAVFDDLVGFESSYLTDDEIDSYRPEVYRHQAAGSDRVLLKKVHDACTRTVAGEPLFPAAGTRLALYVLRNPLDVAVSLAHHFGSSFDVAIDFMSRPSVLRKASSVGRDLQLRQQLLDWSGHVASWVDGAPFPVHVMRYEDMLAQPVETFSAAVRAASLEFDETCLERAVAHSSFDALAAQERDHGFEERPAAAARFFRKGRAGCWREELSTQQADRIVRDHGPMMRRFAYLEDLCGTIG